MQPQEIHPVLMAFPASVEHLTPAYEDIPAEFKRHEGTPWNRLVSRWFFQGVQDVKWDAKPGIDPTMALRHLKCILHSYEPKHEHKEAAVAYLASLWFKRVTVGEDVYE